MEFKMTAMSDWSLKSFVWLAEFVVVSGRDVFIESNMAESKVQNSMVSLSEFVGWKAVVHRIYDWIQDCHG